MKVLVQVRDSARPPVSEELEVSAMSTAHRFSRAAKRLGLAWGLGVAALFVPLLHFVLVPGLLLLGPVLAWLAWRAQVTVTSPSMACAKCGEVSAIEPGTTGWPVTVVCTKCSTTCVIRPET